MYIYIAFQPNNLNYTRAKIFSEMGNKKALKGYNLKEDVTCNTGREALGPSGCGVHRSGGHPSGQSSREVRVYTI